MEKKNDGEDRFSNNFCEDVGGEWKRVSGRRKVSPRTDMVGHSRFKPHWLSSFFFTTFSENLKARELFDIFDENGKVEEVVIPARRDKKGRRFIFVRFIHV